MYCKNKEIVGPQGSKVCNGSTWHLESRSIFVTPILILTCIVYFAALGCDVSCIRSVSWVLRYPEVWPRCRYLVLGLHPGRDGHKLRTFQRRLRDRYVTWPETEMKTSHDEYSDNLRSILPNHGSPAMPQERHHLVQNHVVSQCVGFVLI